MSTEQKPFEPQLMGALAACLLKILTDHLLSERRKTATIPTHRMFHMFGATIPFFHGYCQGSGAEFSKFKRYCHSGTVLCKGFVQLFDWQKSFDVF